MRIDANDPRWTAYALGEIEDPKERTELESVLESSPEMRRIVEEIRHTGDLLTRELKSESPIGLTAAQRQRIEKKANPGRTWLGLRPAWVLAGATAAVVLIAVVTIRQMRHLSTVREPIQIAQVTTPKTVPAQSHESKPAPTVPAVTRALAKAKTLRDTQNKVTIPATPPEAGPQAKAEENKEPEIPIPAEPEQPTPPPVPEPAPPQPVLAGTITDKTGGVIPGVAVSLKDNSTGSEARTITDENGQYSFQAVLSGTHSLTAKMPGFQTATFPDIALNVASPKILDLDMQVGSIAETVVVTSDTALLRMESSSAVAGKARKNKDTPQERRPDHGTLLPVQRQLRRFNTESYDHISDNPFMEVVQNPLSTFSIDVDTASYSNMRRFLDTGRIPPKDSIRIEELVNYFDYSYTGPKDEKPFAVHFELTEAPWEPEHRLLRIGLKGREIEPGKRPAGNLVFLLDVSGSMENGNKLPLVKQSMRLLVDRLTESDRIAIVVYAGDTDVLLPSTSGNQKSKILQAIDRLHAGGSTNGASGIQLAYRTAQESFIEGGVNRVILATDGDFNVGITNRGDLTRLIEEKAKSGIFLSALGFGMGNYKDSTLELLGKKGHGNYSYIDTLNEAKKVLVEQINSTLVTIAKDVKIQVEFNPRLVSAYRLIGYEDRLMAKEDFNDDTKDAGVIGAGHTVTALYELVPAGVRIPKQSVDPLKYQKPSPPSSSAESNELVTVKIRSKEPEKNKSVLAEYSVKQSKEKFSEASQDFKFAAAVAAFGMILRDSPYKGSADLLRVQQWAEEGKGEDRHGYRQEFLRLVHRAMSLAF
jgi:Ca-activated chloride channel homolog